MHRSTFYHNNTGFAVQLSCPMQSRKRSRGDSDSSDTSPGVVLQKTHMPASYNESSDITVFDPNPAKRFQATQLTDSKLHYKTVEMMMEASRALSLQPQIQPFEQNVAIEQKFYQKSYW
ncbi:hypothetical protein BABINDRAFT_166357 [Babjeviella inositovora NRRL Y-12698]|uniref:Uncharacterized protein n=1 Tax=Babjeviella inositovora NRRL Y-12698 TaxID=984486 RepID=A0A1E3QUS5_9ASCO|nr:uncharacterized protein BABINDRAFT_166357 [Babjeviella inositovora NRRL Y-12698]ODQ80772.1 hypothetical protein BABINDRAFT_166357 [Babjeviella inositovora NRRL Y-12698]